MPRASLSRRSLSAIAALAVAGGLSPVVSSAAAQPTTTITFGNLSATTGSSAYVEQGYTFGCVNADTGTACGTLTAPASSSAAYTGSPALFNNNVAGITTLGRVGAGAFDLLSLRMAPFATAGTGAGAFVGPVVFEGTRRTGGTVTQTFDVVVPAGTLTTYTFAETFRDLLAVRYRGRNFEPAFVFVVPVVDDVVVRASATPAVVPEPGTWALLGTGLLALGGVARGRRSS